MSSDTVQGKDDFNAAFSEIYDYSDKPPAKDVLALYDGGEIPPEKSELHAVKGFIDFYRESVARSWFEDALSLDVNKYPGMFLQFYGNDHFSEDMLPFFSTFLDAYLGSGHGVKIQLMPDDSSSVIFVHNDREALSGIAEAMIAKVWESNAKVRQKMEFFLKNHHPGSSEAFKWHTVLAAMNNLGTRPPEV